MPAVTVENPLVLPHLRTPEATAVRRPVERVVAAHHTVEGAGFSVWRPFPGGIDAHLADPFFLLDQLGPVEYAPNEAVGAPWHPHRGFETVTYVIDGVVAAPRLERRRRHHRRGRHAVDDRRFGHPPRRSADRSVRALGRTHARRAALGEPPRRVEDVRAAVPGDRRATTSRCCRLRTAARWCG